MTKSLNAKIWETVIPLYYEKLKSLCTEDQLKLLNSMYPKGPSDSQLQHACTQIENTLKKDNKTSEDFMNLNSTYEKNCNELKEEIESLKKQLALKSSDCAKLEREIENMTLSQTPQQRDDVETQKRLDFLDALEAAGVITSN